MKIVRYLFLVLFVLTAAMPSYAGRGGQISSLSKAFWVRVQQCLEGGQKEAALDMLRPIAQQKNTKAQFLAGEIIYDLAEAEEDVQRAEALFKESFDFFLSAAHRGNVHAANNVALAYYEGKGVQQDTAQAEHWWNQVLRSSDDGNMHDRALGARLKGDAREQFFAWLTAAEAGDTIAMCNLGIAYCSEAYDDLEGLGSNNEKAEKWFRRAEEKGDPAAEFNLGRIKQKKHGGISCLGISWYLTENWRRADWAFFNPGHFRNLDGSYMNAIDREFEGMFFEACDVLDQRDALIAQKAEMKAHCERLGKEKCDAHQKRYALRPQMVEATKARKNSEEAEAHYQALKKRYIPLRKAHKRAEAAYDEANAEYKRLEETFDKADDLAFIEEKNPQLYAWFVAIHKDQNVIAMCNLGIAYLYGRLGLKVDDKKAEHWLRKAYNANEEAPDITAAWHLVTLFRKYWQDLEAGSEDEGGSSSHDDREGEGEEGEDSDDEESEDLQKEIEAAYERYSQMSQTYRNLLEAQGRPSHYTPERFRALEGDYVYLENKRPIETH